MKLNISMNSYSTFWYDSGLTVICKINREKIRPDILRELGEAKGQFVLGMIERIGGSDHPWVNFGIRESTGTPMSQSVENPDLDLLPVELSGALLWRLGFDEIIKDHTYSMSTPLGTIRVELGEKVEVVVTDLDGDLKMYADKIQDLLHLQRIYRIVDLDLDVSRLLIR